MPCDSQRAIPSSLGLTSEIANTGTCEAKNGLVSTLNMDGIDAIYIFTMTASVLAKGFAIVGAVGSVPASCFLLYLVLHQHKIGKAARETKAAVVNRARSFRAKVG